MKVLLTAFDPFGGETTNPALEAVKRVESPQGLEVMKLEVPTVFGKAFETVRQAIESFSPDAIVCVGQAGGRDQVTPERVAINVMDARLSDNGGQQPVDQSIEELGPAAYFSTLPIKKMVSSIAEKGIPAGVSNTAGTFVCNYLMYEVLHYLSLNAPDVRAGFIHVPYIPEQIDEDKKDKPSMPLDQIVLALEAALGCLN